MTPNERKLLDLLSNNDVTFFIPPFQRNYEWTNEQCDVFWRDVVVTAEKNVSGTRTEHFFGAVTYYQTDATFGEPSILVLVDGQQRITTTMLFLAALRDVCEDTRKATFIDDRYLKNKNSSGDNDEFKIKLKQVETDWAAYKKLILGEAATEIEKVSSVYSNYQFFKDRLSNVRKEGKDPFVLVEKGLALFSIITIELKPAENTWENPQEIFESMNSIGRPLSLADLVRNHLLYGATPKRQEELYKKYWLGMEQAVPLKVSAFIRDFMQLRSKGPYPVASEANHKRLYQEFKLLFSDYDPSALLRELSSFANMYSWILGVKSGDRKIDRLLGDFRQLGVTTAYSFILSLLAEWKAEALTTEDLEMLLSAFRIYCVRRRIMKLAAAENKLFPRLVKFVQDLVFAENKGLRMFQILCKTEYATRLPNDIELGRTLETMDNFYSLKYCKFCLAIVEETLTKCRPDVEDDHLLQIEHIMPQTLNAKWKSCLSADDIERHPQIVHSIGNLTLIRHNQELGNKPFDEKKEIYENHAGLQIAREWITDNEEWNAETIDKRAHWLIKLLVEQVLPIPNEMRNTNNFNVKKQAKSKYLSFEELGLIGEEITFIDDSDIKAKVVSDTEVEFEGKLTKLSPLTREIKIRQGRCNKSGAYQGAQYWKYEDTRLAELM